MTVWNPSTKEVRIVEVKGPNDRLSNKQILWIDFLNKIGVTAVCCHVEAIGGKRLTKTTPKKMASSSPVKKKAESKSKNESKVKKKVRKSEESLDIKDESVEVIDILSDEEPEKFGADNNIGKSAHAMSSSSENNTPLKSSSPPGKSKRKRQNGQKNSNHARKLESLPLDREDPRNKLNNKRKKTSDTSGESKKETKRLRREAKKSSTGGKAEAAASSTTELDLAWFNDSDDDFV